MASVTIPGIPIPIPIPGIPSIPIPKVPGVPTIHTNPFDYIKDMLNNSLKGMTDYFEKIFVHPPKVAFSPPLQYLYGSAVGSAGRLAVAMAVLVSFIVVVHKSSAHRFFKALGAIVAVVVVTPGWWAFCDGLVALGDTLANAARFYHPPAHSPSGGSTFFHMPVVADLGGAIVGGGIIAWLGSLLVGTFYTYAVLVIVVKIGMLFSIALFSVAQKLFYWLVAVGLVAMVFGRATAIVMIEFAKMAADYGLGGSTTFGLVFYLAVGLVCAIASQYGLYRGLKHYVSQIGGRVYSRVTGKVQSLFKPRSKFRNEQLAQQAHQNSMPVKVTIAKPPVSKRLTKAAREQGIRHVAGKVAGTTLGATVAPEAAAVVAAGVIARKAYDRVRS